MVEKVNQWIAEAEVVVVGYGGAGAVTAIVAHDAGAKVFLVEKQSHDTPTETKHTPNTRMAGGAWFSVTDVEKAVLYLEGMARVANETLDSERQETLRIFSQHLMDNNEWMLKIGVQIGGLESIGPTHLTSLGYKGEIRDGKVFLSDFPELPGSECSCISYPKTEGPYRHGAALFNSLSEAVRKRGIQVLWETPATRLLTRRGEVYGVKVRKGGKEAAIKASRAVVLTCGGFEFNPSMKENYLRVNPVHFYGNPGNTGDGINMALEVGAGLWHMNNASWRVTMKFPDFPVAFGTQHYSSSVLVDRRGQRFTNERFKRHAFGYELTNYDCHALCYPKVPCYWIFDEKRRLLGPLASPHGVCNPPGGVTGEIYYAWSPDNQTEIDRGWILRADTLEHLADQIRRDRDPNGLMDPSLLRATVKRTSFSL